VPHFSSDGMGHPSWTAPEGSGDIIDSAISHLRQICQIGLTKFITGLTEMSCPFVIQFCITQFHQSGWQLVSRMHKFSGWLNTWVTGVVDRCPLMQNIIYIFYTFLYDEWLIKNMVVYIISQCGNIWWKQNNKKVKCTPNQSTFAFPNAFVAIHTSFIADANMYCSGAKFLCFGDHLNV
jgi:hypothetical protein